MINFTQFQERVKVDSSKKVSEIEISLEVSDSKAKVNITDIMLQGGPLSTIWVAHPSEMRWQHDW